MAGRPARGPRASEPAAGGAGRRPREGVVRWRRAAVVPRAAADPRLRCDDHDRALGRRRTPPRPGNARSACTRCCATWTGRMEDGTTILFGLPGVAVDRVERHRDGRVAHVVTVDESAAACPGCRVFSTSVKQYRVTRPRDLGYGEEPLAVRWHKRQFRCRERGCSRRAFTESIAELPPGARVTGRLRRAAGAAVD